MEIVESRQSLTVITKRPLASFALALLLGACSSAAPSKGNTGGSGDQGGSAGSDTGGDSGSGGSTGGTSGQGGSSGTGGSAGGSSGSSGSGGGGSGGDSGTGGGGSSGTGGGGSSGAGGGGTGGDTGGMGGGGTGGDDGGAGMGGAGGMGGMGGAGGMGGTGMGLAACSAMGTMTPPALKKVLIVDKNIPEAGQAVGVPGESVIYVLNHFSGDISVVQDGKVAAAPLVHIDCNNPGGGGNEQGLLSMALHPDFATNHLFYVLYSAAGSGATTVDEFMRMSPTTAMKTQNIYSHVHKGPHHNGGSIYFSPLDKGKPYLYHSIGNDEDKEEASAAADPNGFQGRVLRYDVGTKAGVPAMGHTGYTFIYGFRNPYRMSIDRLTGDMYIGEIENGPGGAVFFNPGGSEGKTFGYGAQGTDIKSANSISGLENSGPTKALIGGVVYRGSKIAGICGRYFYATWPDGTVKSLFPTGGGKYAKMTQTDIGAVGNISSFGEDGDGEILMSSNGGSVYRIVAGP